MFFRAFLHAGFSSILIAATPLLYRDSEPDIALPTIDLGYAVHQATYYEVDFPRLCALVDIGTNNTSQPRIDAYVFSNIRFAAPPTGSLRFGAPQAPPEDRSTIHDGRFGFICPQTSPAYLPDASVPGTSSEDCLFLDVIVPRGVLAGDFGEVPVLFWFVLQVLQLLGSY